MAEHTPGPWRADYCEDGGYDCMSDAWKIRAGTTEVTDLDLASYTGRTSEAEANARLIAAAPELLEAARTALRELDACADYDTQVSQAALEVLRAVIAKAEGREG